MAKKPTHTALVSKATVSKRVKALLQAAEKAPSKSILAILHDWKRRKAGEAVADKPEIKKDDSGNHYVAIDVISVDTVPIQELKNVVADIVNKEGLPQSMVKTGSRIQVTITERGPCTDAECWQLYRR
jgi:hypothetical protein